MRDLLPTRRRRRPGPPPAEGSGSDLPPGGGTATRSSAAGAMTEVRSRRGERPGTIFPRRRRPAPLVRRTVLSVLLIAGVGLLTVSYRSGGSHTLPGQQQALQVVAPIERGMGRVWAPIAGAYDWTTRLFRATDENPRLRQRVDELERDLAVMHTTEAENSRLRDLLAIRERGRFPIGYRQVMGAVVARSPTDVDRSIVINLGTRDGVQVDDPVMVARGLIGRVQAVSPNAARVGLLVNAEQAVSATVVDRDASGVLRVSGTEGSPVMDLDYVSQRIDVEVGDLVVTSGWSTSSLRSIFPGGIPIGVVSSVGNSPTDLYKTVQVTPFADFDRIDEVIVLVPTAGHERTTYIDPVAPVARPLPPTNTKPASRRRLAAWRAAHRKAASHAAAGKSGG